MSTKVRANRKAVDADIVTLNSVGLSLGTIGANTGVHPTSVTARLHALGIPPSDTRRAFMEDIFFALTPEQRQFLATQVVNVPIKDYIRNLIVLAHVADQNKAFNSAD